MQVCAEGEIHADTTPEALPGEAFDRGVFERTSRLLGPEGTRACLRALHARGDEMLRALRRGEPDPQADPTLHEAAHAMAGSSGLLGFNLVAALARAVETAPAGASADRAATTWALEQAVTDMQAEIDRHLPQVPLPGDMP